ncbi:hypothetical protein RDV84_23710 [Lysobacter yananisis]|uniref:Uncharacterized protein n=2 Tax=Lysobacter TaxID=68 RepID=A0A0S2DEN6_LYSEN|nr:MULTISPECIES: hypothetical protein [Lysobacter]ALN57033.1 hypothetical protein GLE_1677 [Lysobacter enzymogenes]QCW25733.1 hypothetical protein FE772_08695 [Lysobacter enzymogenes]ROU05476.1 hypothetical protein D9T17_18885 [Lysobacter enzymogenes]UZW59181.1 hypothetical protein BV903_017955 [Lysobacter enzymogenes]WMT02933.1 hypothetical protein RDV84_23710 [Lysobacter yananisis]
MGFHIGITAALVAAGLLGLDLYATWAVWREPDLTGAQKGLQSAMVWLLPLLGAIVVLNVVRSMNREPTARSTFTTSE